MQPQDSLRSVTVAKARRDGRRERFSKERWFVEFATFMPIFEEARGLYRYMPLGIPMFSIGRH